MPGYTIGVLGLMLLTLAAGQPEETIPIRNMTMRNKADVTIRMKNFCGQEVTLAPGESAQVFLNGTNNKFWVVPETIPYICSLDCFAMGPYFNQSCFYIAPNVAGNHFLVIGIGYAHNDPVQVHDGVSGIRGYSTPVDPGAPSEEVDCTPDLCEPQKILQVPPEDDFTFEIFGVPKATALYP